MRDATVTWLRTLLVLHVLCMLMYLDPIQGQGQGHGAFELPTIAHNCTFLGLSPPPLSRGAENWWLTLTVWTWPTACRSPIFEFPSRKAITRVQTSPNVDISQNSNGHISVLRNATVTWLGVLVVLRVLYMLTCPWPDPRSRSRSWGFWIPASSEALHAGGDDRSPLAGLSGFNGGPKVRCSFHFQFLLSWASRNCKISKCCGYLLVRFIELSGCENCCDLPVTLETRWRVKPVIFVAFCENNNIFM